jgi:hypothetical protein
MTADIQCAVDLLHSHAAVDSLHGLPCILHRLEGLIVNICGFDAVNLLFEL